MAMLALAPRMAAAQSASQLGAWDGLMLSPVGALVPVTPNALDADADASQLSLRYGRWQYNADDAVHNTIGLTYSHSLGVARTQVSFTGAYLLVACSNCSQWALGGVDLESALWTRASPGPLTADVGLRISVGGAHYGGPEGSIASSTALALPLDIGWRLTKTSSLSVSIVPGLGFGRIASTDLRESGYRPMIGAAVAWSLTSQFGVDLGMERVVIARGPTQLGAGLSWKFEP